MKRTLRMKCPSCGHWNRFPVNKLFVEQLSPEPKVKITIPMYKPIKVTECGKCGRIVAEPRELIRITKKPRLTKTTREFSMSCNR